MNEVFRFSESQFWGEGHWIVNYPEGSGRVSRANDGTWAAFDWVHAPGAIGMPARPALAHGLSTRRDAAIVLRATQQVANAIHAETDELIKQIESGR